MSVRKIVVFLVTATAMYGVGAFIWMRVVQPMIDRVRGGA